MSVLMTEEQFKKKAKKYLILGIFLVIIGISLFIAGPILFMTTKLFYLAFLSFFGVFFMFPGFVLLSLGSQRKIAAFQAQSIGPVAVESTQKYGKTVAREMASGVKEGLEDDNEEKYCKYCGNFIDADSEFCKYCGKNQ